MNTWQRKSFTVLGMLVLMALASCQAPERRLGMPERQLERAEDQLRGRLLDTQTAVLRSAQGVLVRAPTGLLFEPDSTTLRTAPPAQAVLMVLEQVLRGSPALNVRVSVYSDGIGGRLANQQLAQTRAEVLASALSAAGVARSKIQPQGAGAVLPLAPEESAEGRSQNRRVEFLLSPALVVAGGP